MRVGEHLAVSAGPYGWYCPTCNTHWHLFSEITSRCDRKTYHPFSKIKHKKDTKP